MRKFLTSIVIVAAVLAVAGSFKGYAEVRDFSDDFGFPYYIECSANYSSGTAGTVSAGNHTTVDGGLTLYKNKSVVWQNGKGTSGMNSAYITVNSTYSGSVNGAKMSSRHVVTYCYDSYPYSHTNILGQVY